MIRNKQLTRQQLEDYGITKVTLTGRVFMGDTELKIKNIYCKHKYADDTCYKALVFGDKRYKVYNTKYGKNFWTYKVVTLLLNRVVYAWFNDEVPAEYDVDHIDEDSSNNCIWNLQLLSREKNNQKKVVSRNQYNYMLTDEEILEKRKSKPFYYDRDLHKSVYIKVKDRKIKSY